MKWTAFSPLLLEHHRVYGGSAHRAATPSAMDCAVQSLTSFPRQTHIRNPPSALFPDVKSLQSIPPPRHLSTRTSVPQSGGIPTVGIPPDSRQGGPPTLSYALSTPNHKKPRQKGTTFTLHANRQWRLPTCTSPPTALSHPQSSRAQSSVPQPIRPSCHPRSRRTIPEATLSPRSHEAATASTATPNTINLTPRHTTCSRRAIYPCTVCRFDCQFALRGGYRRRCPSRRRDEGAARRRTTLAPAHTHRSKPPFT